MIAPVERWRRAGLTMQGSPASSLEESVLAQQPRGLPKPSVPGPICWLLDDPGMFASSARWQRFRGACERILERYPDNPRGKAQVDAVDALLAWRAVLPEDLHFWAKD